MSVRKFFRKAFWYKPINLKFKRRGLAIHIYPFRNLFPTSFRGLKFGYETWDTESRDALGLNRILYIYLGTILIACGWDL